MFNSRPYAGAIRSIAFLNYTYAGSNLHFYRLGNVNYMDYNNFVGAGVGWIYPQYSYVKSAFNVYVGAPSNFTNQPNSMVAYPDELNTSTIKYGALLDGGTNTHSHETGHHLGLLHTHGATITYIYPAQPGQPDYPDPNATPKPQYPRELVIRDNAPVGTKLFTERNCYGAGDLCCETNADCALIYTQSFPDRNIFFPKFNPVGNPPTQNCMTNPANCLHGCYAFCTPEIGLYCDYNGDPIVGEQNNVMSYHDCGNDLKQEQLDRAAFYYNHYWTVQYQTPPINIRDKVDFMNTATPMKSVTIQWRHPNDPGRYANTISNKDGNFQSILYDPVLRAKVWKLGSGQAIEQPTPSSFNYIDKYTYADWVEGIKVCDLARIKAHILNSAPLNGWQKIAADANHSNTINSFDMVALRRLLLKIDDHLPNFEAPWRFIPEYIPEDNLLQFNANPFQMLIDGQMVYGTPYTEADWVYQIEDGFNGKSGYDGLHIGDIDDCMEFCESEPEFGIQPALLSPGQTYTIAVSANQFTGVSSFQLGLFVDNDKIGIQEITSGQLTDFTEMDNAGLTQLENNELRFVWEDPGAGVTSKESGAVLFGIKILAKQAVTDLNAVLHLEDTVLENAIFSNTGCENPVEFVGTVQPVLGWKSVDAEDRSLLKTSTTNPDLLCFPNPASGSVTMAFENALSEPGRLHFLNVNGQILWVKDIEVRQGVNTITLNADALESIPPGIITVMLQIPSGVKLTRLIKL